MARQIPELDELLGNYASDDDMMLIRDESAKQDKRITLEELDKVFDNKTRLLNRVYPVGSEIEASSQIDLGSSIGGEWQLIYSGKKIEEVEVANQEWTSSTAAGTFRKVSFSQIDWADEVKIVATVELSASGSIQMRINDVTGTNSRMNLIGNGSQATSSAQTSNADLISMTANAYDNSTIVLQCFQNKNNTTNHRRWVGHTYSLAQVITRAASINTSAYLKSVSVKSTTGAMARVNIRVTAKRNLGTVYKYKRVS